MSIFLLLAHKFNNILFKLCSLEDLWTCFTFYSKSSQSAKSTLGINLWNPVLGWALPSWTVCIRCQLSGCRWRPSAIRPQYRLHISRLPCFHCDPFLPMLTPVHMQKSTLNAKHLFALKAWSSYHWPQRDQHHLTAAGPQCNMVCQHNPKKCWMFQVPFIALRSTNHQQYLINIYPKTTLKQQLFPTSDLQLLTFPFYMLLFELVCIFLFHYVLPTQIHGFPSLGTDYCTICSLGLVLG